MNKEKNHPIIYCYILAEANMMNFIQWGEEKPPVPYTLLLG